MPKSRKTIRKIVKPIETFIVGWCLLVTCFSMIFPIPSVTQAEVISENLGRQSINLPYFASSVDERFIIEAVVLLWPWQNTRAKVKADDCLEALWINAELVEDIRYPLCHPHIHTIELHGHLRWGRNLLRVEIADFGEDAEWHMAFDEYVTPTHRIISILVAIAAVAYCWFRLKK